MKTRSAVIVIPTALDLDETNPYIPELLTNLQNCDELLTRERELFTSKKLNLNNKTVYLIFDKVNHFDISPYNNICI